jgi:hypothetical protein
MSLATSTTLAVTRDATDPGDRTVSLGDQEVTWGEALVSAIPTEILAPYTAGLGLVASLTSSSPDAYWPFRLYWYFGWLAVTPIIAWLPFRRKAKAHPTVVATDVATWKAIGRAEIVAPTLAAAAWFTTMSGSPWQVHQSSGSFQITTLVALSVDSLLVGLITPAMTKPTAYKPPAAPVLAQVGGEQKSERVGELVP